MGLLEVESIGRHSDGRVIDYRLDGPSLHRLRLTPDGLDENPYDVALHALDRLGEE